MLPPVDEIIANFELLEDWDERYRYLIELGRLMDPLPETERTDLTKVKGCASQVWLKTWFDEAGGEAFMHLQGESDAHIVRGLVALLTALYEGRSANDVLSVDALDLFKSLGLSEHLTPQRSNGVRSMVERIRSDARARMAQA